METDLNRAAFVAAAEVAKRLWQDVKAGAIHPIVSHRSNYEMYGRMLAGIEPPLMLI